MLPGLHLRQVRERLGLTYRDVERLSYALASRRGRSEFILHKSRLADIENRGVVPTLHKLYTIASLYHLNPVELCRLYEIPLDDFFRDSVASPAPRTHLMSPPAAMSAPAGFDPSFDPRRTEILSRLVRRWGHLEGILDAHESRYRYGYVGLSDRRMVPILRPGSVVLIDVTAVKIEAQDWACEYDRPIYFVEIRAGYRCGWFDRCDRHLIMQPHPLSHCLPETWRTPEEAEVVGRVVGIVTRLNEPWTVPPEESPARRANSSRTAL